MARQDHKAAGLRILLVWLAAAALTTGCASRGERMQKRLLDLGETRLVTVLRQSLAAAGGLEAWAGVTAIDGEAVSTVFEPDTQALVEQQCRIEPTGEFLVKVSSREPAGRLIEQLDDDGESQILLEGAAKTSYEQDPQRLYGAAVKLFLLGRAMLGPAGLLEEPLSLRYAGLERKNGRLSHKIEVTGQFFSEAHQPKALQNGNLLVIWIDETTHRMDRLWLRYPKKPSEFGYLSLQAGNFAAFEEGRILPKNLAFSFSDPYQQLGQQPLITMEFDRLQIQQQK
ncbi:MAG: hypothetical protein JW810_02605 [Sedimentisphaerales bacterium]|nr:hypothetical protein [Sedimentisphaerales bacterium]